MTNTTNLCVNPSIEVSTAGWCPISGAVIAQNNGTALAGQESLSVTTPGIVSGEGVYGPGSAQNGTVLSSSSPNSYWTAQNGEAVIANNGSDFMLPGDYGLTSAVQFTNFQGVIGYAIQNGDTSTNVTVTAGSSYTVSGWFYNPDPNGQIALGMAWDDGTVTTNVIDVTVGMWEYISTTVTAPSDVTSTGWPVFGANTTDAYTMYGADVQVQAAGAATTGAVSGSLQSLTGGTVLVAAATLDGTLLSSAAVTLSPNWTQFSLAGFSVPAGAAFRLLVVTQGAQATQFWLDAVQYETGVTTDSPYIDGYTVGCEWLGTPNLSISYQLYKNAISASGSMQVSGYCAPILYGLPVYASASGFMTLGGKLSLASDVPSAAFTDFAIWPLTDQFGNAVPDPAMTYADQNNAGADAGMSPTYASTYGIFYPPQDYVVSNGYSMWKRAAFMALGLYFSAVPVSATVNITDIQATYAPVPSSGVPVPPAFENPRQVKTIIKPTRLNYCTNPSFETSTANWTALGAATLAQDNSTTPSPVYNTLLQLANLTPDNDGVTTDNVGGGNFDGSGNTYSATAIAGAGFGLYAETTVGGVEYNMPDVQPGALDNVQCQGQTILVSDTPGATYIGFLGASTGSGATGASGYVTFTYTDGTTSTQLLGLTDWTMDNGATTSPSYGNQVAAAMTYYNDEYGNPIAENNYLFTAMLPLTSGKTLDSITLPDNPDMHVFAVSLASVQENTAFGEYSCKVTVTESGDGLQLSVPELIVGDDYTVSLYLQAGNYLNAITAEMQGGAQVSLSNDAGGVPYGGTAGVGYGQGAYGGVTGTGADITAGVWYRVDFTFTATTESDVLSVSALTGSDLPSGADTNFWIDGVLIEAGQTVGTYFDGSFGSQEFLDYQWESTPGLSRSYYYEQFLAKSFTVQQVLNQHIPLGITAATPAYLTPPTQ